MTTSANGTILTVEAEPYTYDFPPSHTALLIIDMQRDFLEPGGFGEMLGNDVSQLRRTIEPNIKLLAAWRAAIAAADLQADAETVECLFVAVWGGRRYLLRAQPPLSAEAWIAQMQRVCALVLHAVDARERS